MDAPGIVAPGIAPRDPARENEEQTIRNTYFDPKFADDAVARAFAPDSAAAREGNRRLVQKLAGQHRYHDEQLQSGLYRIRLPTHIIWGANDKLLPPIYGETWQQAIAGARLTLIPRSGHLPIQEQPDLFATAVADFCARV
jgi:pimeloyl-ACP methyl ester carboxylesterase